MKTITRDLTIRNRHFAVVQNEDGYYLAIEHKYIGKDGRLNTALNGFQMFANTELRICLASVEDSVEIDYLVEQGHTYTEAVAIRFDLLDRLTELESIFG